MSEPTPIPQYYMASFDGYSITSGPVTVVKLTAKQAILQEPYQTVPPDNQDTQAMQAWRDSRKAYDIGRAAAGFRNRVSWSELYPSEQAAREALRADIGRAYDAAECNARRLLAILESIELPETFAELGAQVFNQR